MSFHLVPLLPMLVAMVTKFFMCEGKVSNLIYFYFVILFFFINNQGKQHKMLIKRPVVAECCRLFALLNF